MPDQTRLRIQHLEASNGPLGSRKEDNTVFPGEELFLRFTVEGAQINDDGFVNVDLEILLRDATGTELLCVRSNLAERIALGRNTFPAQARVQLPPSCIAGDYVLTLKVQDHLAEKSDAAVYPFILKPVDRLSIINPRFYYDFNNTVPAPSGGMVGQTLFYNLSIIGMEISSGRIKGRISAQVYEKNTGERMMPRPVEAVIIEENEDYLKTLQIPVVDFLGQLVLTRAGEFTLEVTVTDVCRESSGQVSVVVVPGGSGSNGEGEGEGASASVDRKDEQEKGKEKEKEVQGGEGEGSGAGAGDGDSNANASDKTMPVAIFATELVVHPR